MIYNNNISNTIVSVGGCVFYSIFVYFPWALSKIYVILLFTLLFVFNLNIILKNILQISYYALKPLHNTYFSY